jgi:magnesium transporter
MIHTRIRTAEGQIVRDLPIDQVGQQLSTAGLIWLDLHSPAPEEVESVAQLLGWTDFTAEDLIKQRQRGKLEEFEGYTLLVMHDLRYSRETRELETPEVDFVVGRNYLASIHYHPMNHIDDARETEHRLQAAMASGPDFLLYVLADQLVDGYFPTLDDMHEEVEELEQAILSHPDPSLLPQIFDMKRTAVALRRVISPQMEAFSLLTSPSFGVVTQRHLIYFRDVHDHLIRIMEAIDSYRDLMSGVLDAYLSNVSNRLNEVVKRLTVLSSLFLPLTFVTGLLGMNMRSVPPWHDAYFWVVLALMGCFCVVQILYFKAKGWI